MPDSIDSAGEPSPSADALVPDVASPAPEGPSWPNRPARIVPRASAVDLDDEAGRPVPCGGDGISAPASDLNVLGIDSALRLDPDRTDRSVLYAEALCRLGDSGRACVERMENLLYAKRLRARDCARGDLYLPDSVFKCREGQLWYHFSPKRRRFILSFFSIHGRGGGIPVPEPETLGGGCGVPLNDDCIDGIAARIASYASRGGWDVDVAAMLEPTFDDSATGAARMVRDIARTHSVMVLHHHHAGLPDWSLLSGWTTVHQQLESPFARAIFVGEVTCRLVGEVGSGAFGRALRLGPAGGWAPTLCPACRSAPLLEESRAILDAVHDNMFSEELRSRSRYFLTASLMDSDLMADERRLALVRSELILRLAMSLASEVGRSWHGRRGGRSREAFQAALPRRYALLSEFVRVSGGFFGRSGGAPDAEVVRDLAECRHKERSLVTEMARSLLDFGTSALLVVDLFSGPSESDWHLADELDMDGMHARLSNIASEILGTAGGDAMGLPS